MLAPLTHNVIKQIKHIKKRYFFLLQIFCNSGKFFIMFHVQFVHATYVVKPTRYISQDALSSNSISLTQTKRASIHLSQFSSPIFSYNSIVSHNLKRSLLGSLAPKIHNIYLIKSESIKFDTSGGDV